MEFFGELWMFMREKMKFWLLPLIMVMVMFGFLVVFVKGSAIAPLIYTVF